jgi:methyl-accepting chemotaxis protein
VEAARAGDAGKGFAVVAVEVRRLAQSAAGASAEVKALIEQSSAEVVTGSRKVSEATQKVTSMLDGISENGVLIEEIAGATHEQSSAIGELTSAVRQVDEMTQHNAALVEETNAAIEQTEGQANELDRIVEVFVMAESAPEPRVVPRAPVRGKAAVAARTYLSDGNAAIKAEDWAEF